MSFKKIPLAMLAVLVASTPVLAQSANSPRLAVAAVQAQRSGATTADSNQLRRGGFIIPALAVIAIILGILAATSGGGNRPTSP